MYSVIIPSLGRISYINELLTSIQKQSPLPGEIILLLDDNEHCRSNKDNIKLIDNLKIEFLDSVNLAQKRNIGAEMAKFDLILYSDDDDLWMPNKADLVLKALSKAQVCCHNYGKFGTQDIESCGQLDAVDGFVKPNKIFIGSNIFGGGSSISATKSLLKLFPFSAEYRYCEDYEWWVRLLIADIKIYYLSLPLVKYRTHSSNMTRAIFTITSFSLKISKMMLYKGIWLILSGLIVAARAFLRLPVILVKSNKL